MGIRDLVLHNKKLHHDYSATFTAIFGVSLTTYLDMILGFDIVGFDNWLGTPDDVSTADYLEQKYGELGVSLIKTLIG